MSFTNPGIRFIVRFLGLFTLAYLGTRAWIGLTAPGGLYLPWLDHWLDYPAGLRNALLGAAKSVCTALGYPVEYDGPYRIRFTDGRGVRMVYSCLGIGLLSFWLAFTWADNGFTRRFLTWLSLGWLVLFSLNVARICLLLIAVNRKGQVPFGWEHHAFYNAITYGCIALLLFIYYRCTPPAVPTDLNKG